MQVYDSIPVKDLTKLLIRESYIYFEADNVCLKVNLLNVMVIQICVKYHIYI